MATNDRITAWRDDLALAAMLLTRLPVPINVSDPGRSAASCWAWPLIGAALGAATMGLAALAMAAGLSPGFAAALAMAGFALMTGALHEDGLADTADGLWGGRTPERRLEIMRDSRIGAYGVVALILVGLMRWSALSALVAAGVWAALPVAAGLSRAGMAGLMHTLPFARDDGLSRQTGRPPRANTAMSLGIAVILALWLTGTAALPAALATLAAVALLGQVARAKIGGQTGDILGAAQQLSETAALAVFVALLA
ncbi:MAG: adenosylcobinamide-GDP ribazoletransferase [Pseudomonadota bacterium]